MIELNKKLQILEESLWLEKTRFDLAYMDGILDAQFFEYGRSGCILKFRVSDTDSAL